MMLQKFIVMWLVMGAYFAALHIFNRVHPNVEEKHNHVRSQIPQRHA